MRYREKERLVEKLGKTEGASYSRSMFFRPFEADAKKIEEIARFAGETKSDIVRKLVHATLTGKEFKLAEDLSEEKLDWLVRTARKTEGAIASISKRTGESLAHSETLENRLDKVEEVLTLLRLISLETFCLSSIGVSSLNHTYAKLLELLSPEEIERTHSLHVANQFMTVLIEHGVKDLERCLAHNGIVHSEPSAGMLYTFSKIERLKSRSGKPDRPTPDRPELDL
jgi:hypothetical protein